MMRLHCGDRLCHLSLFHQLQAVVDNVTHSNIGTFALRRRERWSWALQQVSAPDRLAAIDTRYR